MCDKHVDSEWENLSNRKLMHETKIVPISTYSARFEYLNRNKATTVRSIFSLAIGRALSILTYIAVAMGRENSSNRNSMNKTEIAKIGTYSAQLST